MSAEMHDRLTRRLADVYKKKHELEAYLLEFDDHVAELESVTEEAAIHSHVQHAVALDRWLDQALAFRP